MSARHDNEKAGGQASASPIPPWIILVYLGAALVLAPWTVWLYSSLPPAHLDRRWNLVWAVFDGALLGALALTAYLAWRKSGWLVVAATAATTLLLTDAWFDTTTAAVGPDYALSLVSALGAEIPLACVSLWIVFRTGRRFFTPPVGGAHDPGD